MKSIYIVSYFCLAFIVAFPLQGQEVAQSLINLTNNFNQLAAAIQNSSFSSGGSTVKKKLKLEQFKEMLQKTDTLDKLETLQKNVHKYFPQLENEGSLDSALVEIKKFAQTRKSTINSTAGQDLFDSFIAKVIGLAYGKVDYGTYLTPLDFLKFRAASGMAFGSTSPSAASSAKKSDAEVLEEFEDFMKNKLTQNEVGLNTLYTYLKEDNDNLIYFLQESQGEEAFKAMLTYINRVNKYAKGPGEIDEKGLEKIDLWIEQIANLFKNDINKSNAIDNLRK